MKGSAVYLTKEEKQLILDVLGEPAMYDDEEFDRIRKRIKEKMEWHLNERY